MPNSSPVSGESTQVEARELLLSLDSLRLDHYTIVGNYVRFAEATRSSLKELKQRVIGYLHGQSLHPSNFLIWGAPGSGKSYLVQQISGAAGSEVEYRELNLAKLDQRGLVEGLDALASIAHPVICLIDEADAKPNESWPYEVMLPYLEPSAPRPHPTCFCLAGSGGSSLADMKASIRARSKGSDLLSRIARGNEFVVDSLGIGDKMLVSVAQLLQSSREEGKEIREVEKLALFFIATHPGLASARQLRNLASESARRVPVGEDRIRYDYLFGAGDPENKEFWVGSVAVREGLSNSFVHVEDATIHITQLPPGPPPSAPTVATKAPTVDPRRIVVLPFANISPDPNDEYFADGMTEELIEKLAHVSGLKVIARTTAMHYKNSRETALDIGRALSVGSVAECSVRKAGLKLRITAQLIDTTTEEHLWSGKYDRELDDVFAIQEDIAGRIAQSISDHFSSRDGGGAVTFARTERDTQDMVAYTEFLHGRKLFNEKGSEKTVREALAFFERAVARDPKFARARVGIADCVMWLGGEAALPWADSMRRGREEIAKALELNEGLAEAHSALASILLTTEDFAGAEREARRAIALNPSLADPYRWLAQVTAGAGHIDETVRLLEKAQQVDPLDINIIAFLGRAYFYSGRETEALAHWERTKSLVAFRTNAHLTEYYLGRGEYAKAQETLREMERLRPTSVWTEMFRGFLAARQGDAETAHHVVESLLTRPDGKEVSIFLAAFVHFALGEMDGFFECIERARREGSEPVMELMYSPLFRSIRSDPRFVEFATKWSRLKPRAT